MAFLDAGDAGGIASHGRIQRIGKTALLKRSEFGGVGWFWRGCAALRITPVKISALENPEVFLESVP